MKSYTTIIVLIATIILVSMLQMTVFSRLMLLHGTADIVLLVLIAWNLQEGGPNMWPWTLLAGGIIAFASALPFFAPIPGYLIVTGIARLTQRRIWQSPILAMLLVTLIGTLIYHLLSLMFIFLEGGSLQFNTAWNQVTLPSMLLNLILAIPVYALIHSLSDQLRPLHERT
jgi:cell shape-determining protein MreD